MTNNTPQPVYGMNQPAMQPVMQPTYSQPFTPAYQPAPVMQPMQPAFNAQFTQASYGLAGQPGPIVY